MGNLEFRILILSVNSPLSVIVTTWYLAWGKVDTVTEADWQDEQIAIFLPQSSASISPLTFSPSGRFLAMGEVWLSERQLLAQQWGNSNSTSASDLQLIVTAWEHWGVATLKQLVGMFGLVVWDREQKELWLGRDRTGGRTIYYTVNGSTHWIAPNLRSLAPYHTKELDLVALRDYLCCAFVPGEQTLWRQVRELRPGTVLQLPEKRLQVYWQLQEQITETDQLLPSYSNQLRVMLEQVVQEYLPAANEPVGVFLSDRKSNQ
ncbi:MAG: asparagine synthase, partial [Symploca sp. SIO3E6]|nr:asparagine synthase [Caldora sp. SIO3E6]